VSALAGPRPRARMCRGIFFVLARFLFARLPLARVSHRHVIGMISARERRARLGEPSSRGRGLVAVPGDSIRSWRQDLCNNLPAEVNAETVLVIDVRRVQPGIDLELSGRVVFFAVRCFHYGPERVRGRSDGPGGRI
jgi:hypothetical protein